MKRLFWALLLVVVTQSMFSAPVEAQSVTAEIEVPQEVLTRIDALAKTLGTTAEMLWTAMVKQAKLQIVWPIVTFGVGMGLLLLSLYTNKKYVYWNDRSHYDSAKSEFFGFVAVVSGILVGVMVIVLTIVGVEATMAWLNPEYWAYKHIFPQ